MSKLEFYGGLAVFSIVAAVLVPNLLVIIVPGYAALGIIGYIIDR